MQRSDLKEEEYQTLLGRIVAILLRKGLKSATMDDVASELGMSKRTLYEIFGSKSEMIKAALGELERQTESFVAQAFARAGNVMEAFVDVFKYNRDIIGSTSVDFYRDLDLYKDKRKVYEKMRDNRHAKMHQMFCLGIKQGMFRPDVDFNVQGRLMGLQMEALKRIEELFPPEIPLQRVFDSVIIGFLRSIASEKGMKILDSLTSELTTIASKQS